MLDLPLVTMEEEEEEEVVAVVMAAEEEEAAEAAEEGQGSVISKNRKVEECDVAPRIQEAFSTLTLSIPSS